MGFLLAIEGLDASGKATQTELLVERARGAGLRAASLSFPRYGETLFARSVEDYLAGRYGDLDDVDPHLAALLFAGDRFESRTLLERSRAGCELLVLDRYVPSNIAYQGARVPPDELAAFAAWLDRLEHEVYGLPRPDLVLLLDVPAAIAAEARAARGRGDDIHERRSDYLERVAATYDRLAAHEPGWRRVACSEDGALLPRERIHERVWDEVRAALAGSP